MNYSHVAIKKRGGIPLFGNFRRGEPLIRTPYYSVFENFGRGYPILGPPVFEKKVFSFNFQNAFSPEILKLQPSGPTPCVLN